MSNRSPARVQGGSHQKKFGVISLTDSRKVYRNQAIEDSILPLRGAEHIGEERSSVCSRILKSESGLIVRKGWKRRFAQFSRRAERLNRTCHSAVPSKSVTGRQVFL